MRTRKKIEGEFEILRKNLMEHRDDTPENLLALRSNYILEALLDIRELLMEKKPEVVCGMPMQDQWHNQI